MKHLSLKVEGMVLMSTVNIPLVTLITNGFTLVVDIIGNKQLLVSLFCEDNYKDMCVNALLVEKGYAISTGPWFVIH